MFCYLILYTIKLFTIHSPSSIYSGNPYLIFPNKQLDNWLQVSLLVCQPDSPYRKCLQPILQFFCRHQQESVKQ